MALDTVGVAPAQLLADRLRRDLDFGWVNGRIVVLPGLVPKIKTKTLNTVAESRRPNPILCEDLGTIRGEIFPEYGPERVRLRGVNGGYEYPVFRVRKIKNRN